MPKTGGLSLSQSPKLTSPAFRYADHQERTREILANRLIRPSHRSKMASCMALRCASIVSFVFAIKIKSPEILSDPGLESYKLDSSYGSSRAGVLPCGMTMVSMAVNLPPNLVPCWNACFIEIPE